MIIHPTSSSGARYFVEYGFSRLVECDREVAVDALLSVYG